MIEGGTSILFHKRLAAAVLCAVFSISAATWVLAMHHAFAAPNYSPYATGVATSAGLSAGTAQNAVGAPDSKYANFVGLNNSLTLDMGEGQEGTGALQVDMGSVTVQTTVDVSFLDNNQTVIASGSQTLVTNTNSSKLVFSYDWHASKQAYRYVKIATQLSVGLGIDAVEKLGYIGATATQDLDGDGITDRQDARPLVFDGTATTPTNGSNGTNGGNGSGGSNGSNGTNGTGGSSGTSGSNGSGSTASSSSNSNNGTGLDANGRPLTDLSTAGNTTPLSGKLTGFVEKSWSWILFYSLMLNALLAVFVAWVFAGARRLTKNSTDLARWHHHVFETMLPKADREK